MEIFLLISYLSEIKIHYFLKIPESNKITLGVQRSMQIYDDGSITCRYVDRMRNNIKYCEPTFIRTRNFPEVHKSLIVAKILAADQYLPCTCSCYKKAGVDKAWSRILVTVNQFISGKQQNKVVMNSSWFIEPVNLIYSLVH